MEAHARPVAPARGIVVNSRRPCLSQMGANPHVPRIVSMPDSNAASSATGGLGAGGRRGEQQGTDRTTTTRVSSTAGVTPSHSYFFILLLFPYLVPWWCCCICVCDWWTLAIDKFSSSQTPDARLRAAIATPPKFRSPGLHLELLHDPSFKTRIHFYLWPFLVLAHVPLQSPDLSRFQCCIHPDRVSCLMLVLVPLLYFAEPTLSPS